MEGLPQSFAPATRAWLESAFATPTAVQQRGWPLLASGHHALLLAPTGSGKTLAAFLAAIDRLGQRSDAGEPGVRVLYVSPLKALVYDIERNLRAPLTGISTCAEALGEAAHFRAPRIAVRTGDTPARERRLQTRDPAEILVTTPESLYLILGSRQRETLRRVETIIVDEVHALAPTKRGVHLALSLERVARLCGDRDPQRIGLSATARPPEAIARYLGGDRAVEIVDASAPPALDFRVFVPVPDMTRPGVAPAANPVAAADVPNAAKAANAAHNADSEDGVTPAHPEAAGELVVQPEGEAKTGLWPAIHPALLERIRAHRSSIVFVNSRGLCERLARHLNELAGEPLVRAHHGSLSQEKRREIESALAAGRLRAIVATSSLELGIDMAAVDLVMLVESPGSVSRGLQRIGRAGHTVGETSRGIVFPKHRADLLEATVVAAGMRAGAVEAIQLPRQPLDVLAQQIVAIVAEEPIGVETLRSRLARSASYAGLSRALLDPVLDMLAGRYPSTDFAELRPRLVWDRGADRLEIREGAGRIALLSGGTIPDRGLYAVHLGVGGPRIGELDEEMVHETKAGDVVVLGASSWRVLEISRDRVVVGPAPGEVGRLPFWRGEGPGRPVELGRALGRFTRELLERESAPESEHGREQGREQAVERADGEAREPTSDRPQGEVHRWLIETQGLDDYAARNLLDHLRSQREWTGSCPSDRRITIERFRDELGDWRVCILSPFGARLHAPWALAISARLAERALPEPQTLWNDDGIMLRFADADRLPAAEALLPDPEEIEELVLSRLESSALFASEFRENAARALLLPRRRPGLRTPLWAQRLRAQSLLAVAGAFPDFPIMLETYRSCLQDRFDLPALVELMESIRAGRVAVDDVETTSASPFARSLVFAYTAAYLYQGDMPVAERRSQALTLDRHMLRELLGPEALRELLDAEVIDGVEARLQGLEPELRARHADGVHDLLRRVGDLDVAGLAARFEGDDDTLCGILDRLEETKRIVRLGWAADEAGEAGAGSEERFIAAEDAALYRDALGLPLPPGLPAAFLAPPQAPLEQLVLRHAQTHGPFRLDSLAQRFGLRPESLVPLLDSLCARGRLVVGELDPRGTGREWCESAVLRRIKRGTLEQLRAEVAPVPDEVFARFLLDWHRIGSPSPSPASAATADRGAAGAAGAAGAVGAVGAGAGAGAGGADADRAAGAGRGARRSGEARLDAVLDRLEGCPLSFAELESSILPVRLPDFESRWLDARGAEGRLVWVGSRGLGERDGRVAIYDRDRIALWLDPPETPADLSPLARRIVTHLETRGASFFAGIAAGVAARDDDTDLGRGGRSEGAWADEGGGESEVLAALWELVWRGLVTNDTFAPLRALGRRRPPPQRRRRGGGRHALPSATAGRWSLVATQIPPPPEPTERLYARCGRLLERHGLLSREAMALESQPGGFGAIYPMLRELEDSGRVRRGHFVQGLVGAQLATIAAVERLRALRTTPASPQAVVLAATDPAQAYGVWLDWPASQDGGPRPRRAPGAIVVLVDGRPALYLDRGSGRMTTFEAVEEPTVLEPALAALVPGLTRLGRRRLVVGEIDGEPARQSSLFERLVEAGFRAGYRGLELDRLPHGSSGSND